MTLVAVSGWLVALALGAWALLLRSRLEAVARADHELRGPVAALALAAAALARAPGMRDRGIALEGQVDRLRAALADLAAARHGGGRSRGGRGRPPALPLEDAVRAAVAGWAPVGEVLGRRVSVEWGAGTAAAPIDGGRLAQALGNVLANALEHGGGDVAVRAQRAGPAVRIEVRDAGGERRPTRRRLGRGRGLAIATRAAEEAGGKLALRHEAGGSSAVIELPAAS